MIRNLVSVLILVALSAGPALAQSPPPESEDSRFQFHKVEDGFLRLDQRTGQVSLCRNSPAGWACQLAPEERSALEAEIARLQGETAGLKQALADKGITPPQPRGDSGLSRADLDRMAAAVEKAWRRLVEMLSALQKDMNKT